MGLFSSEDYGRSLSHFDTIPACDRQTDGFIIASTAPADAL